MSPRLKVDRHQYMHKGNTLHLHILLCWQPPTWSEASSVGLLKHKVVYLLSTAHSGRQTEGSQPWWAAHLKGLKQSYWNSPYLVHILHLQRKKALTDCKYTSRHGHAARDEVQYVTTNTLDLYIHIHTYKLIHTNPPPKHTIRTDVRTYWMCKH